MRRISIDAEELEEIEDRSASLQVRLYRAQKERDEARAERNRLQARLDALSRLEQAARAWSKRSSDTIVLDVDRELLTAVNALPKEAP